MSESGARVQVDRRSIAAVFLSSSAITMVLTWPLAAHLTTMVPSDVGDPVLNTWILWWNAYHLPLTDAWWNAPNFFPATGTLAFSEHLLGLTPIATPIIWLTGNPQLGYNITFLLTFPLSVTTAYLLCLDLTGRRDAALLGGLAFGFAPYRIAHLSHIQLLASFWMPVALLGLHRFVRHGGVRWLALFAAAWLMQALSNGYFLAFFSVLIGLWLLWFVRLRDWRKGALIGVAWLVAAAPMMPILVKYRETHALYGLTRQPMSIRDLSADAASVLDASPLLSLWGNLHVFHRPEGALFTGATVVAIVALGIGFAAIGIALATRRGRTPADPDWRCARSTLVFYALAAVAMYGLALGPSPTWRGQPLFETGPYAWLMYVPGMTSLRVPARFGMLMALCLSLGCALAFAMLSAAWARRWQRIAAAALALAIVSEAWIGAMPLWDPPRPWNIRASEITGALLVLPILNNMNEAAAMYRAMAHGRPLVNGYSGHTPPWYRTLVLGLNNRDPAVLEALASGGVTQIAVVLRSDRDGSWQQFAATRATLARVSDEEEFALYDLRPVAMPVEPTRSVPIQGVEASSSPESARAMVDGSLATRWYTSTAQQGGEHVLIDLGGSQQVSAVELRLGPYSFGHPRELIIDVSVDGSVWREVWRGRGEAPALAGAFRAADEIPMLLTFGDQSARFLRLRQVGRDETAAWTIAELRVLAPGR